MKKDVLRITHCNLSSLQTLLNKYQLDLNLVPDAEQIPGSYWGNSEAGLIKNTVFARSDTPIHSLLHETCHYICMDENRRKNLNTNAEGDYDEENGVCYLQILLADDIPEVGKERMMQDMDRWGYTFRLGSAQKWFEDDSEDTLKWLEKYQLIKNHNTVSYKLRK